MAPARDDPEVLRLACLLVQILGLLGREEGIRAAVDKQDRGGRDLADDLDGAVLIGDLPRKADPGQHPGGGQAPGHAPDEFRAPGSPPTLAGVFPLRRPADRDGGVQGLEECRRADDRCRPHREPDRHDGKGGLGPHDGGDRGDIQRLGMPERAEAAGRPVPAKVHRPDRAETVEGLGELEEGGDTAVGEQSVDEQEGQPALARQT